MKIKIILVDDHDIVRKGLAELLDQNQNFQIIGEASDGRQALDLLKTNNPDVIILDIGMKNLNGIETTSLIKEKSPDIKILMLSMYSTKNFVTDSLKAGASGYILKNCSPAELYNAIETVAKGKTYLSPEIAHFLVEELVESNKTENLQPAKSLTNKEREIVQLIAEGYSRQKIAKILKISDKTVYNYVNTIMNKLNIFSIAEITKYAIREGISTLDN